MPIRARHDSGPSALRLTGMETRVDPDRTPAILVGALLARSAGNRGSPARSDLGAHRGCVLSGTVDPRATDDSVRRLHSGLAVRPGTAVDDPLPDAAGALCAGRGRFVRRFRVARRADLLRHAAASGLDDRRAEPALVPAAAAG